MKRLQKLTLLATFSLGVTVGCAHKAPNDPATALVVTAPELAALSPPSSESQETAPETTPLFFDIPDISDVVALEAAAEQETVNEDAGGAQGDDKGGAPDIWQRIRAGMTLGDRGHPGIARELAWFKSHQDYLDRVVERARPYMHFIVDEVERRGMPAEIALLPVVESAFQPFAYSHGRAAGIWQFIPGTGRRFGLKQTWWYDGRRDIANSTRAALDYLQALNKEFDGDWQLALAAYNSGEGKVHRARRINRRKGRPTDFWSLKLPRETKGYVPKLLAISAIVADPAAYGVTLKRIPDEPFLTAVDVGSQIDLDLAAELAGITLEEMYRYNPAFNRWATDPDGPHSLLVPIEVAQQFKDRIEHLPPSERIKWANHKVRRGDTLSTIAKRYRTTIRLIRSVNNLRSNRLRAGNTLVIPVARKNLRRYSLSAAERLATKQETPRKGTRVDYVVRDGDTLWGIASAHGVSIKQLAKWNGMAPRDPLATGKRLVIWTNAPQSDGGLTRVSLSPRGFVHPQQQELQRRIAYRVRSGDSATRIARKFRVRVRDVLRWNKLSRKSRLYPGQRLTLFIDVTRQSGNI